ncbi:MAG: BufA1 family periplasmic bufferin-type metallophore [Rhodanobacteraceae bacterium]
MQSQTMIKSALLSLLAAGTFGAAATAVAGQMGHDKMAQGGTAKCYGVNAANKNDCQTPGHSCTGLDSKARDPNAYVEMPSGLCTKIAGGSLTAGATMQHDTTGKQG